MRIEKMSEIRTVCLNPKFIDTVNPRVLPYNGRQVTVTSWHSNVSMLDRFPNDEWVGHIEEFGLDLPESELI
jgi:hypothetical protein